MSQELLPRESRIISILAKNNGLTSMQILKATRTNKEKKMGRGVLYLALDGLQKKGFIKMDKERKFLLQNEIKDKKLSGILKMDLIESDLDKHMDELKKSETPFEIGFILIRVAMYALENLTLEQYSPELSAVEKKENRKLVKHCNLTIKKTFETLEEINYKQTIALKKGLKMAITIPFFELKMGATVTNSQLKKASQILKKIMKHYPDQNLKNIKINA